MEGIFAVSEKGDGGCARLILAVVVENSVAPTTLAFTALSEPKTSTCSSQQHRSRSSLDLFDSDSCWIAF